MKRGGFLNCMPGRKVREETFENWTPKPRPIAPKVTITVPQEARPVPKVKPHRSAAIRESARDEQCLIRLPGCIGHVPGATIWSHYRGSAGGKGMATKSADVAGAYGCTACDQCYDSQTKPPPGWTREMVELAWHEAHIRSLVRLHEKGLL